MDKVNAKTIWQRINAETPVFFRKIRIAMASCAGLGTALIALPPEHTAWLPVNTIPMIITVGAVGTFLSSLAVKQG